MPPAETPSISARRRAAPRRRGRPRAQRGSAAARSASSASRCGHLTHQPRCLERADLRRRPRAGQVVERRERRAVRQPRRGRHDVGVAARAAVRDPDGVAWRSSELSMDGRRGRRASITGRSSARPSPSSRTCPRSGVRAAASSSGSARRGDDRGVGVLPPLRSSAERPAGSGRTAALPPSDSTLPSAPITR